MFQGISDFILSYFNGTTRYDSTGPCGDPFCGLQRCEKQIKMNQEDYLGDPQAVRGLQDGMTAASGHAVSTRLVFEKRPNLQAVLITKPLDSRVLWRQPPFPRTWLQSCEPQANASNVSTHDLYSCLGGYARHGGHVQAFCYLQRRSCRGPAQVSSYVWLMAHLEQKALSMAAALNPQSTLSCQPDTVRAAEAPHKWYCGFEHLKEVFESEDRVAVCVRRFPSRRTPFIYNCEDPSLS